MKNTPYVVGAEWGIQFSAVVDDVCQLREVLGTLNWFLSIQFFKCLIDAEPVGKDKPHWGQSRTL